MGFINTVLGIPLGFIIYLAYRFTNSYGFAILIFAVIVRILMFPINILAHRNSIRLLQLQPSLNVIKQRYAGEKERLNEEQYELFKREKYSPFIGLVPLFLQLFLVMGMLQVMYHPLQHILRLDANIIDVLIQAVRDIYGTTGGFAEQLTVLEAFRRPENLSVFQTALYGFTDAENILNAITNMDLRFLGINLGTIPSFTNPSPELIIPVLSGAVALAFCLVQNAISPGAMSQSFRTNRGLTIFTVALSLYFAFVTPAGVGVYWTAGNLLGIAVVFILNILYNPKKLAVDAIAHIEANRKTSEQIREEQQEKKRLKEWENRDSARFNAANKQLVFYALTGGQYRYYRNIIEYLLEHSEIDIHYLTNYPKDAVFQYENKRLISYYASQQKTISLMLKLDTDIMATTVPDLQTYHMKRSIVRDDIEYIFIPHSLASIHVTMKETACDRFDTVFCVGNHQVNEVRYREELANLPRKTLVKTGYGLYDQLAESYKSLVPEDISGKPKILIAPSWQTDNILDLCIDDILKSLIGQGYEIIVRPHPQYIRLFPERMKSLIDRYSEYINSGELTFVLDFSDNSSVFLSDVLITDWSNIAFEFSYCTLKPSIFINTPMKVMNPNYEKYDLEIVDITLRDKVGVSVDTNKLNTLYSVVSNLLSDRDGYKEQIKQALEQYLYYPDRNGEAGGKYIIGRLKKD